MGYRALLQGIFPTQRSDLSLLYLLHWQVGSLPLVPSGKHKKSFYFSLLFLEYRTKSCLKQYGLNLLSNSILWQEHPFGHAVLSTIIFFLFISYITPNFLSACSSIIIYLACSAALVICFPSTFPLFHSIFPLTFISVVIHGLLVSHTNYKLQQDISVFIHYFILRTLTQCLLIVGILQLLAQWIDI